MGWTAADFRIYGWAHYAVVHFSQTLGSDISYCTTSLSPCYCDVWYAKTSYINLHSTTHNCHCQYFLPLWLQYRLPFDLFELAGIIVQNFYTSQSLGSIDSSPLNDAPATSAGGTVCGHSVGAV